MSKHKFLPYHLHTSITIKHSTFKERFVPGSSGSVH